MKSDDPFFSLPEEFNEMFYISEEEVGRILKNQ